MIHGCCSWNIFYDLFKCSRLFKSYFAVPSHMQENLENTHTHTHTHTHKTIFLWKILIILNYLFLQFNSRINRGFNFCEYSLSEEIRGILLCKYEFCKNIYLPKYIFRKHLFLYGNTKILVSYIDISVSGSSAFYFLNV